MGACNILIWRGEALEVVISCAHYPFSMGDMAEDYFSQCGTAKEESLVIFSALGDESANCLTTMILVGSFGCICKHTLAKLLP